MGDSLGRSSVTTRPTNGKTTDSGSSGSTSSTRTGPDVTNKAVGTGNSIAEADRKGARTVPGPGGDFPRFAVADAEGAKAEGYGAQAGYQNNNGVVTSWASAQGVKPALYTSAKPASGSTPPKPTIPLEGKPTAGGPTRTIQSLGDGADPNAGRNQGRLAAVAAASLAITQARASAGRFQGDIAVAKRHAESIARTMYSSLFAVDHRAQESVNDSAKNMRDFAQRAYDELGRMATYLGDALGHAPEMRARVRDVGLGVLNYYRASAEAINIARNDLRSWSGAAEQLFHIDRIWGALDAHMHGLQVMFQNPPGG